MLFAMTVIASCKKFKIEAKRVLVALCRNPVYCLSMYVTISFKGKKKEKKKLMLHIRHGTGCINHRILF